MGIILASREYLYENRNDSSFGTVTGDTTTILKANVGDRVKEISTIQITVESIATINDSDEFDLITVDGKGRISRLSGSFIDDGLLVGDVVDFTDESVPTIHLAGAVIESVTDLLIIVDLPGTFGPFTEASVKVIQDITELNFRYTANDANTIGGELDSLTESIQEYKNIGVGLGGPRATTFSSSTPRLPRRWVTHDPDGLRIRFVRVVNTYIQEFEYEHIFTVTQYFKDGQQGNLTARNPPNPFKNGTLAYNVTFKIGSSENAGALRTFEIPKVGTDSVGWFEESFDGGEDVYSVDSFAYELVSDGTAVTSLEVSEATKVTAVIKSAGASFIAADPVTIFHSYNPTKNIYTGGVNTDTYNDIWLQENKRTTIGAGSSSGSIIENLVVTLDAADQITVVFEVNYSTAQKAQLSQDFLYSLAIIVEDSSKTNNTTNRVTKLIDPNSFTKNSDTPGLLVFDKLEVYPHDLDFVDSVSVGFTDFKLTDEDGVLVDIRFHLVTETREIGIRQLSAVWIAHNTVTGNDFTISEVQFPVSTIAFTDALGLKLQQLSLDTTRGFLLQDGDQFNFIKIETDNFSTPNQFYNAQIGLKIPWQEWERLVSADPVFFDALEPQNGLNKLTSRYSANNNYVLRLGIKAVVKIQTLSNVKGDFVPDTIYQHVTPDSTVDTYGDGAFTSTVINIIDQNIVDVGSVIIQNEDVTVKTTFDDSMVKISVDNFEAITRLQAFEQGTDNSIHEISSLRGVIAGDILKPLPGETNLKKSIIADNYTAECLIDGLLLNSQQYTISSRLFESAWADAFRMQFDGVNEDIVQGNDPSLDFERTDTFTIRIYTESDDLSSINRITGRATVNSANRRGLWVQWLPTGEFRLRLVNTTSTNELRMKTTATFSVDTEYHLLVTYDGSSTPGGVNIYVNGVNEALTTEVNNLSATIDVSGIQWVVGNCGTGNDADNFSGFLNEVAVWNVELDGTEATEDYNGGAKYDVRTHSQSSAVKLVLYNQLGDGAAFGTDWTFPDLSASGNTGTSQNMEFADRVSS